MKGASLSEGRSWSNTPLCVANKVAVFTWAGQGGCQLQGGLMSGWLIGYQGNLQRGTYFTATLIRTITSKVGRSDVNRVRAKQVLVEQVMYREQENSHPEWSAYTIFREIS